MRVGDYSSRPRVCDLVSTVRVAIWGRPYAVRVVRRRLCYAEQVGTTNSPYGKLGLSHRGDGTQANMDIVFERGSRESVKGHALLYFRSSSEPDEVWGTYMVVLPITVDVSKYVPPFLMNQFGELGAKDLSAFAFPPAPERLGSYNAVEQLAGARDDDILYGGTINPSEVTAAMMAINEAVQTYADLYAQVAESASAPDDSAEEAGEIAVNEVLYSLMSDGDKLSELTKLVGTLRFAVEGSDVGQIREAEDDIVLLAKHLPDNNNIAQMVEALKSSNEDGPALADLYLQRCYHLVREEYPEVGRLEDRIRKMAEEQPAE